MNFGLTEEQVLLQRTLQRFLEEQCGTERVRRIMESETGHDPDLWTGLAELGLLGLTVPAAYGGAELEMLDLALVAEELGYGATPGPFLGTAMATIALVEGGDEGQQSRWLPGIAAGETVATVALGEADGEWDPTRCATRAQGGTVSGEKPLASGAAVADLLIVGARDDEGSGLWVVERGSPGVEITPLKGVDMTRRVDAVRFREAAATKLARGGPALDRVRDAGLVLLAADAFGGARRCLDMTVRHVMEREQFGRVIARFQAVKHQVADMAAHLEPARSLWWYAAHAFDRIREQSARHAALAKAHLTDVFDRITRDATELHGGIGFTWEFDLHLWFRRAVFDRSFLGDAAYHRARAADLAGW